MNKLWIIFLIGVTGCHVAADKTSDTKITETDSTLLHFDTATIAGEQYNAFFRTDDILYVINMKGDTILKEHELYRDFVFEDFDGDGLTDIRIHYMSNVPGVQDLLLFDKEDKTFRKVDNLSSCPDPKRVLNTRLYYSYHRSGCADANWDSDLFFIENYKTHKIANIAGRECNNEGIKDGIYISRIEADKNIPIETMPIEKIEEYQKGKWQFIENYWNTNHKRFDQQ
jgi:hypothetical protein